MRFTFFICLLLTAFRFQDTLPKEAITQMIATEKAFAKMALDKNTPAAFLYFFKKGGGVPLMDPQAVLIIFSRFRQLTHANHFSTLTEKDGRKKGSHAT